MSDSARVVKKLNVRIRASPAPAPTALLPLRPYSPPVFSPGSSDGAEFFRTQGYAVWGPVLTPPEVEEAGRLAWDFLEGLHPAIRRDQPATWINRHWPSTFTNGIVGEHGVGQSDFLWYLRTRAAVNQCFESLWRALRPDVTSPADLITSFDGANFYRPWSYESSWKTTGSWYHVDQGQSRSGFQCAQGVVLVTEASEHTGGLVVVPGSHLQHVARTHGQAARGDYVPLDLRPGDAPVLVCCPAGSLITWDSRTVHCNSPALKYPSVQRKLLRVAGYVCQVPRSLATPEVLRARRQAYERQETWNHWPQVVCPKKKPRFPRRGDALTEPATPHPVALTPLRQQLI